MDQRRSGRRRHLCRHQRRVEKEDIRLAKLFHRCGLRIGYFDNEPLYFDGGSTAIFGGAGSGKGRDLLIEMIINLILDGKNLWVFDPKGELFAVVQAAFAKAKAFAYPWNPFRLHGLGSVRINPLSFLRIEDLGFEANCRTFAENLIPLSGSPTGQHFELTARDLIDAFLQTAVRLFGQATFGHLNWLIRIMVSDAEAWQEVLRFMRGSGSEFLERIAGEIWSKQQKAEREFAGLYGTITQHLSFLNNPKIMDALDGEDFDLSTQCSADGPPRSVFFMLPIEYTKQMAGLIRCFFGASLMAKSANPQTPSLTMIVDEAGNMGRFDALLQAITYYRGAGVVCVAVFQDTAQVVRAFDGPTLQSLLGSCPCRIFLPPREIDTSRMISALAGYETLSFDDSLAQDEARRRAWEALQRLMRGEDPMQSAFDFAHFDRAGQNRSKMQRLLIAPEEALALSDDQMVIFIAGRDLPPILANKYPYFTSRSLNGLWLPNPHHPPLDRVKLPGFFRSRWVDVVTEFCPPAFSQYPQYASGLVQYVRGFRPW